MKNISKLELTKKCVFIFAVALTVYGAIITIGGHVLVGLFLIYAYYKKLNLKKSLRVTGWIYLIFTCLYTLLMMNKLTGLAFYTLLNMGIGAVLLGTSFYIEYLQKKEE